MRARKTLGILLGVATIVFGAALAAQGTSSDCDVHTNHNGTLPSQYDYGVFIERSPSVEITSTHSENPRDYGAGSTWDIVKKCNYPVTTTTIAEPTTTTIVEETTTTVEPTTTTTTPGSSSTTIGQTTTTQGGDTTTSEPLATTTTAGVTTVPTPEAPPSDDPPAELPHTGFGSVLPLVSLGLLLAGAGAVGLSRRLRGDGAS